MHKLKTTIDGVLTLALILCCALSPWFAVGAFTLGGIFLWEVVHGK